MKTSRKHHFEDEPPLAWSIIFWVSAATMGAVLLWLVLSQIVVPSAM